MGLLNAIKDNVQASYITFGRHIRVSKDPERYETFLLTVTLLNSGDGQTKTYSTCEY